LLEDADSSFSGNNLRLNWSTADATAREFLYVALGSAATPTAVRPKSVIASQAVMRAATR
jgi:hypothetical protein